MDDVVGLTGQRLGGIQKLERQGLPVASDIERSQQDSRVPDRQAADKRQRVYEPCEPPERVLEVANVCSEVGVEEPARDVIRLSSMEGEHVHHHAARAHLGDLVDDEGLGDQREDGDDKRHPKQFSRLRGSRCAPHGRRSATSVATDTTTLPNYPSVGRVRSEPRLSRRCAPTA